MHSLQLCCSHLLEITEKNKKEKKHGEVQCLAPNSLFTAGQTWREVGEKVKLQKSDTDRPLSDTGKVWKISEAIGPHNKQFEMSINLAQCPKDTLKWTAVQIHTVSWMLGACRGNTLINLAVECSRKFTALKQNMSHGCH